MMEDQSTPNNILQFPVDKIVREPQSDSSYLEEIQARGTKNYADFICDELADNILTSLHAYGIDLPSCELDLIWALVAIKSGVYRSLNLTNPHQQFFDQHKDFVSTKSAGENENDTD
jgi:hypothetical protein